MTSRDTEAEAILREFSTARRIAIGTFFFKYGWKCPWFRDAEARSLAAERVVIFAGLMPTMNPTGNDRDAGQLDAWRAVAATKPDPAHSLRSLVIDKLIDDLRDAALNMPRQFVQPTEALSLERSMELWEWEPEAASVMAWSKDWERRFPIVTAIFRDDKTIDELKRILRRGRDGIRRQRDAELAELRMELV